MALNNGQGAVSSKNNALTDGNLEPFTVTRHGNGRDWWILIPERNSNHYRRFLLNPYGVFEQATIEVGEAANCMRVGSSIFSMDGRRFARQQNCKTIVFDFDRCNGVLTNPLELSTPDYSFGGGGVAFSPDGSHLFCTTQMAILSANLQTPTPKFDTLVNTEAITGAGLHYMQYAPNGKQIYISILHRSLFFSSLDSLNSIKPIYNQKALSFPVYTVRSLPNFPNYRLYDLPNSPCDTLGINTPVSASEPTSIEQNRLILYPNPATDKIQIKLPKSWHGKINIALTNTFGQLVHSETMDAGNGQLFLPLVSLPNGLYVCWAASVGEVPLSMVFAVMR